MKARFPTLTRALSRYRSHIAFAALAVAALMPVSARATNPVLGYWSTLSASTTDDHIDAPIYQPNLTTASGYGPSVNFQQDVDIDENGTVTVDSYLNSDHVQRVYSATDLSYMAFPGAGDYYCNISLSGGVSGPLLDGNGDPYIYLYDGSTGDGPQIASFSPLDGSHSATLASNNHITVTFSGIIAFNGAGSWGAGLSWSIFLDVP